MYRGFWVINVLKEMNLSVRLHLLAVDSIVTCAAKGSEEVDQKLLRNLKMPSVRFPHCLKWNQGVVWLCVVAIDIICVLYIPDVVNIKRKHKGSKYRTLRNSNVKRGPCWIKQESKNAQLPDVQCYYEINKGDWFIGKILLSPKVSFFVPNLLFTQFNICNTKRNTVCTKVCTNKKKKHIPSTMKRTQINVLIYVTSTSHTVLWQCPINVFLTSLGYLVILKGIYPVVVMPNLETNSFRQTTRGVAARGLASPENSPAPAAGRRTLLLLPGAVARRVAGTRRVGSATAVLLAATLPATLVPVAATLVGVAIWWGAIVDVYFALAFWIGWVEQSVGKSILSKSNGTQTRNGQNRGKPWIAVMTRKLPFLSGPMKR
jgi:predicted phage tail protein